MIWEYDTKLYPMQFVSYSQNISSRDMGMWSTRLLPLHPATLWDGAVIHFRVQSMGQTDLNKHYSYSIVPCQKYFKEIPSQLYIYIYIYICRQHFFIDTYLIEHKILFCRHIFLLILSNRRIDLMIFGGNWLINHI